MERYKGKGVYGAIAFGSIFRFRHPEVSVECVRVSDTGAEKKRTEEARARSIGQLREIYDKALNEAGEEYARIFEIHMMMLEDAAYNEFIENMIETRQVNAEYAVSLASDHFAARFAGMDDVYLQARAEDIRDISRRMLTNLARGAVEAKSGVEQGCSGEAKTGAEQDCNGEAKSGVEKSCSGEDGAGVEQGCSGEAETEAESGCGSSGGIKPGSEKLIVCADDLAPSETALLDKDRVAAFVTARGSVCSHTAILAGSRNIPAVVGVGEEFLAQAAEGTEAIVYGFTGEVYLNPDRETLALFERKQREGIREEERLLALKGKENITLDGKRIDICANIGGVGDVAEALSNDAGGSEFLYLGKNDYPTEEEQFAAYKEVLEGMGGRKVIIRTLDIGADKRADYFNLEKEENPALGYRAIRICLTRPELFRVQLRALYRASAYGRLGIMFPMITSVWEVEKIREICEEVKAQLAAEGIKYSENVEFGIMIETPAAALISHRLASLVDFFSVGTNDLTQYTLACDRQNPRLEGFCDPHHEAVLGLIRMSAENAHRSGAWIGICGELAADTGLTEDFLRMGIDELSVSPGSVLKVRDKVRSLDLSVPQPAREL